MGLVLAVRPGLTDPATILFRDEERLLVAVPRDRERYYHEVLLPAKLKASVAYLHKRTWKGDLAILLRTADAWSVCPTVTVPMDRCLSQGGQLID